MNNFLICVFGPQTDENNISWRTFLCCKTADTAQEMHLRWKCGVMNDCLFRCADYQEPYAVVVLLEKDLVVIDLAQNG